MRFADLLGRLPVTSAAPPVLADAPPAFVGHATAIPGYVRPEFCIEEWPDDAAVVLVEAPGAVGKSAAAAALAEAANWPLVLAEKAQVGSWALSGLIQDSLGIVTDYMARIATGHAGVVVDSLDEALFKAGTDNFFAFLDNIQKVAGGVSPGANSDPRKPSIVLFSRSEAAELVKLSFLTAGVPLAQIRLDFFGHDDAAAFIDSYLEQRFKATGRTEYNVFRASQTPFERLRVARLKQIAALLTRNESVDLRAEWKSVREFLGYAPVLAAIAESLAVSNPAASRHTTLDADSKNDLLRNVVISILEREQRKLVENLEKKLTAHSSVTSASIDRASLYTLQEQCARLIGRVEGIGLTQVSPLHLPSEVRPIYEEAAAQFLLDHPFLRRDRFASVVFSDFVRAAALNDIRIGAELAAPAPLTTEAVGPFFARFLADSSGREPLEVPEQHVEAVIWSWDQEQELAATTQLVAPQKYLTLIAERGSVSCDPGAEGGGDIFHFEITDLSGAYQLGSRLRMLSVFTDQGVVVGERSQRLEMADRVVVVAQEIAIESESMRVSATPTNQVILIAESLTANYLRRVESETDDLHVHAGDLPPLLRPYRPKENLEGGAKRDFVAFSQFVDLRNILMAFRPSLMGARIHSEFIENRVLRDLKFRRAVFADLMDRSIIRRDGTWFYLETGMLAPLGFGLNEVKGGEPSGPVIEYLRGVKVH